MNIAFEDVLQEVDRAALAYANRRLTDVEIGILKGVWEGLDYRAIARQLGYQPDTLRGGHGYRLWQMLRPALAAPKLNKSNFKRLMCDRIRQLPDPASADSTHHYFGNLDLSLPSFGREAELQQALQSLTDHPLVMVIGPNGTGKTSFLSSLVQRCQSQFEVIFYCRGETVPSVADWHAALQQQLPRLSVSPRTGHPQTSQPRTGSPRDPLRDRLVLLQQYRCLLVFDQADDLLQPQASGMPYRPPADYQQLLRRVVQDDHQSCVLWVSPGPLGADIAPSWQSTRIAQITLSPLTVPDVQALTALLPVTLTGTPQQWQMLTEHCGGNADFIRAAALYLQEYHHGQIVPPATWQSALALEDLLNSKWDTFDATERVLLLLLSIQAQPLAALKQWTLALPYPADQIHQAIERLKYRYLIVTGASDQPMELRLPVMARYLRQRLVSQLSNELYTESLDAFHAYPLLIPTGSQHAQAIQHQGLLLPVVKDLHRICQSSTEQMLAKLYRLLAQVRQSSHAHETQAVGNLLNIASQLQLSMAGANLSHLHIACADLSTLNLQGADLSGSTLRHTVFAQGLQTPLLTTLSPAGQTLVVGDGRGQVNRYDLTRPELPLTDRTSLPIPLDHLAFAAEQRLLWMGNDQCVRLWPLRHPPLQKEALDTDGKRLSHRIQCLSRASNVPYLALGQTNGQVLLIHTEWGNTTAFQASNGAIQRIAIAPDGTQLATYAWDTGEIIQWVLPDHQRPSQLESPSRLASILLHRLGSLMAVHWQSSSLLILEEIEQQLYLRRASDDVVHRLPGEALPTEMAAFSDNGQYLAVGGPDSISVYAIAPTPPTLSRTLRRPNPAGLRQLAIDNQGIWVCVTTRHQVTVWQRDAHQYTITATPQLEPLYQDCQMKNMQGMSAAAATIAQHLGAQIDD